MEDSISLKSTESIGASDDYEFVAKSTVLSANPTTLNIKYFDQPLLDIANNGDINDLCMQLKEVLSEEDKMEPVKISNSESIDEDSKAPISKDENSPSSEKHDENKSDFSDDIDVYEDVQQECTNFSGVCYLGSAKISAPTNEAEIQRNMAILNEQSSDQCIRVSISVPSSSEGIVVLYEANTKQVIARYEIHQILFFQRGVVDTPESSCFAFTWSHGENQESSIYRCHAFRCDIPEAVGQVSSCFSKAFHRTQNSMTSSMVQSDPGKNIHVYVFEVTMEIKEEDGRGGYSVVPKDRSCFKLRVNLEKIISLTVQQVSSNDRLLEIERCFGVLVSPGRNVKHSDMRLLEMVSMGAGMGEKQACVISGHWDPAEPAFQSLNVETPRDCKIYITVAIDLVIKGIREPVRFLIETPVKIFHQNERFWYISSRKLVQQFYLNLKATDSGSGECYEVLSIETSGELDRNRLNLNLNLASFILSPSISSVETLTPKEDDNSDNDEPLLSGTGDVSKDCSESELESWAEVLTRWRKGEQRPKQLAVLVKSGIPEALRGEVWQRLAGCENDNATMDNFRILITKDCNCENVIQRDINRTFPAHDYFKEAGGLGQDSLYRISKAYAVYDSEVGYCQGLSFLAATLLLHTGICFCIHLSVSEIEKLTKKVSWKLSFPKVSSSSCENLKNDRRVELFKAVDDRGGDTMPEEQAFCVLVKLMYQYGLRNLYKDGFECLYMRLYQLNRLMEEQLPQLWQHLTDSNVEPHMFASQWFLTVFTARFPLYLVFHILDVFLLQGIETLFQVALALLTIFKKDLLQLDFESILKYFRVTLPKKCRSKDVAQSVMKLACSLKVKKLKKYEHEFLTLKEAQDNADNYTNEIERLKLALERSDEEKNRLDEELVQVKNMLKREVDRAESDARRNNAIIAEYKQICARLDNETSNTKAKLHDLRNQVLKCEKCKANVKELEIAEEKRNKENLGMVKEKDPQLALALERIRELELELARTKLERVEAECWKQELTHQLHAALDALQTAKTSWIHKTISSIKEVTNNKKDNELLLNQIADIPSSDSGELLKKVFAARRTVKDNHTGGKDSQQITDRGNHAPVERKNSTPCSAPSECTNKTA